MNNVTEAKVKDTLPAATADKLVIDVRNLQKSFGKQEILKDISLQLGLGENLVVLGKSGSGKSVLIKCLVGLLRP
ncbi:MAG TPA: ATP-binding cassette domain-containing protein, partial [Lacibacter sp.]|nr:ATP-binding cassette domain-containing protein [Lacibacter sp.]